MKKSESNSEKVLSILGKFSNSTIEILFTSTGINKLLLYKILKPLVENKQVVKSETTPPTYSIAAQKSDKAKAVVKNAGKESDEVKLPKTGGRNTDRYVFNKLILPKSRLVLEVLRQFAADNKRYSLEKVQEIWKSDELQKRYGTIVSVQRAKKFCEGGRERHFMKYPITIGKQKVVVSNQWSEVLLVPFLKIASSLKYKITKQ